MQEMSNPTRFTDRIFYFIKPAGKSTVAGGRPCLRDVTSEHGHVFFIRSESLNLGFLDLLGDLCPWRCPPAGTI